MTFNWLSKLFRRDDLHVKLEREFLRSYEEHTIATCERAHALSLDQAVVEGIMAAAENRPFVELRELIAEASASADAGEREALLSRSSGWIARLEGSAVELSVGQLASSFPQFLRRAVGKLQTKRSGEPNSTGSENEDGS